MSVCWTQISSCNYRDVPSKGERPLSAEPQEDGLPILVGGVITVWEDTHTKNNMKSTEWGFTFKDIHRKKTYFSLNVLHVMSGWQLCSDFLQVVTSVGWLWGQRLQCSSIYVFTTHNLTASISATIVQALLYMVGLVLVKWKSWEEGEQKGKGIQVQALA